MDKLSGMLILVDPGFNDARSLNGQLGFITSSELKDELLEIGFRSLEMAAYPAKALLVIKPKDQLYAMLTGDGAEMEAKDFKILMRINLLQEEGSFKALIQAMELLLVNPAARTICMESLEMHLQSRRTQEQQAVPRRSAK